MESVAVTVNTAAEASQFNALREDVIANVSAISEVDPLLSAHTVAAASVHGLPSGVSVLGAASDGLFVQYATAEATWTHAGGQWENHGASVNWGTAWNNLLAVAVGYGVGSVSNTAYGYQYQMQQGVTTCSITLYIYNAQGENTSLWADFIGIGN